MALRAEHIDTERLALEPLRVDHADEMVRVLADPSLYAITGGEPPSLTQLRRRYEAQVGGSGRDDEWWGNWILRRRDDRRAVGFVQTTVIAEVADVAWVVGVEFQGQGFASEAAHALVEWLRTVAIVRATAHIHPDHARSHGVARAAGFVDSGHLDEDGESIWVLAAGPTPTLTAADVVVEFLALSAVESTYSGAVQVAVDVDGHRAVIVDDGRGMQLAPDPGDAMAHAERALISPYPIVADDPYVEALLRGLVWGSEGCQGPYRANRAARSLRYRSRRDGSEWSQGFSFGVRRGPPEEIGPTSERGTVIELQTTAAIDVEHVRHVAAQLDDGVAGLRIDVMG